MAKRKQKQSSGEKTGGLVARKKRSVFLGDRERPVLVELPHGPAAVVHARSTAEAWAKFKELCGIISTEHQPIFKRPGPDCETDENGIVRHFPMPAKAQAKKPDLDDEDWDLEEEDLDVDEEE